MNRIESLLGELKGTIDRVHQLGFQEVNRSLVSPTSAKGGFVLVFVRDEDSLELEFLDDQFEIRLNSRELFGPTVHTGFGGNMFPSEKLPTYLPAILKFIEPHAKSKANEA